MLWQNLSRVDVACFLYPPEEVIREVNPMENTNWLVKLVRFKLGYDLRGINKNSLGSHSQAEVLIKFILK